MAHLSFELAGGEVTILDDRPGGITAFWFRPVVAGENRRRPPWFRVEWRERNKPTLKFFADDAQATSWVEVQEFPNHDGAKGLLGAVLMLVP